MKIFYLTIALILLLNMAAGMWRIIKGPTPTDRMLSAQLFSSSTVAIILLLSQVYSESFLWDIALIFALLAAISAVAFVRRAWPDYEALNDRE